jgi:hypothetical protein
MTVKGALTIHENAIFTAGQGANAKKGPEPEVRANVATRAAGYDGIGKGRRMNGAPDCRCGSGKETFAGAA